MADYPQNSLEFRDWFSTEQACRDYLFGLRWPDGFRCPRCQKQKVWRYMSRPLYRCAGCDYQFSLTAGTLFEDSHKQLRLWFEALWYVVNQKSGVSALGLQRVLKLGSYHTAWKWLHKLRRAMVRPGRDRLTGTIEVDEIFIGGPRPGKRGRGAAGKELVLIAAQVDGKRIGRIRLCLIPDATGTSLERAVRAAVEPGSIIHTDDWKGYHGLKASRYRHQVIRHESHVGDNLLPMANMVASLLKRWLLGTHQGAVRPSYLEYYLDEYTFRFNRRTSGSRGLLFYRLLQQAVALKAVKGRNLTVLPVGVT